MVVGLPISLEAACCGIYVYMDSSQVGLKSKETLRTEYIKGYEQHYLEGLERRRRASKKPSKPIIPCIEVLSHPEWVFGCSWSAPVVVPHKIISSFGSILSWVSDWNQPDVVKPATGVEWVSHGVDLLKASVQVKTPSSSESVIWGDPDEDDFWEPFEEEEVPSDSALSGKGSQDDLYDDEDEVFEVVTDGEDSFDDPAEDSDSGFEWADEDSLEDSDSGFEWADEDEDESFEAISDSGDSFDDSAEDDDSDFEWDDEDDVVEVASADEGIVPNTESRSHTSSTPSQEHLLPTFSDVSNGAPSAEKTTIPSKYGPLSESEVRRYIKENRMCTEEDIISAFCEDREKVRSIINSALRKCKIYNKHGKFTV